MVGQLAGRAVRRAMRFRVSSSAQEDIRQDALAKALKRIEGAPLELDPRPEIARRQMIVFLQRAVHFACVDHIRKVMAHVVTLAEYTDDVELPRTTEGGEGAETVFFAMTDKSMAEALTEGFASSMDDAVKEAERLATAMHSLVNGMKRDLDAVTAGLSTPWSSGQVEGQVTRAKLIKRMGFGRANLDLLRRRILLRT